MMIFSLHHLGCQFDLLWLLFVVHSSWKNERLLDVFCLGAPRKGILNKWVCPYQGKKVAFSGVQSHCLTSLGRTQ
jgi:hypothetical protein